LISLRRRHGPLGKLYLFGKTDTGQFGDGNRKVKNEHPSVVPTLKKFHIVQSAISNVHVAALTDEGMLWTWGTVSLFLPFAFDNFFN